MRFGLAAIWFSVLALPAFARAADILDPAFGSKGVTLLSSPLGGKVAVGYGLRQNADGTFLMGGVISDAKEVYRMAVWRLDSTGHLDPRFGKNGIAYSEDNDWGWTIDEDARGRIIVGGFEGGRWKDSKHGVVKRFLSSGDLDATFGDKGTARVASPEGVRAAVYALHIASDGKVYLAGSIGGKGDRKRVAVWRLSDDGKLDPAFGQSGMVVLSDDTADGDGQANAILLDRDSIWVAGNLDWKQLALWKLDLNGKPDAHFAKNGRSTAISGVGRGLAQDANGKIIVGGFRYTYEGEKIIRESAILARFLPEGASDRGFGQDGSFVLPYPPRTPGHESFALSKMRDGRIYIAGYGDYFNAAEKSGEKGVRGPDSVNAAFWRFDPSGNLDRQFGDEGLLLLPDASGKEDRVYALLADKKGGLWACGLSGDLAGKKFAAVWRLRP